MGSLVVQTVHGVNILSRLDLSRMMEIMDHTQLSVYVAIGGLRVTETQEVARKGHFDMNLYTRFINYLLLVRAAQHFPISYAEYFERHGEDMSLSDLCCTLFENFVADAPNLESYLPSEICTIVCEYFHVKDDFFEAALEKFIKMAELNFLREMHSLYLMEEDGKCQLCTTCKSNYGFFQICDHGVMSVVCDYCGSDVVPTDTDHDECFYDGNYRYATLADLVGFKMANQIGVIGLLR